MKAEDVKIGKTVIYYPIIGYHTDEVTTKITSDVFEVCGTKCCMIEARRGCIAIESLEEI